MSRGKRPGRWSLLASVSGSGPPLDSSRVSGVVFLISWRKTSVVSEMVRPHGSEPEGWSFHFSSSKSVCILSSIHRIQRLTCAIPSSTPSSVSRALWKSPKHTIYFSPSPLSSPPKSQVATAPQVHTMMSSIPSLSCSLGLTVHGSLKWSRSSHGTDSFKGFQGKVHPPLCIEPVLPLLAFPITFLLFSVP